MIIDSILLRVVLFLVLTISNVGYCLAQNENKAEKNQLAQAAPAQKIEDNSDEINNWKVTLDINKTPENVEFASVNFTFIIDDSSIMEPTENNPLANNCSDTPNESVRKENPDETPKKGQEKAPSIKSRSTKKRNTKKNDSSNGNTNNRWVYLISSPEDFASNWKNGDNRGQYYYSPSTKTILIDSVYELGTVSYKKNWSYFEFEILARELSSGNFDMTINNNTIKLGNQVLFSNVGGWAHVRIQYNNKTKEIDVFINRRLVNKATCQGNEIQKNLECKFNSGGGQPAKVEFRNFRIQ